jgi:hypothetical protein
MADVENTTCDIELVEKDFGFVILEKHREFSGDMFKLHKHGDVILNALTVAKGKKAIRQEPIRTIYKTIQDMCEYADKETLMCEVKHRLDGLLFYQAGDSMHDTNMLAEVYYKRRSWMEGYDDKPASYPIFDTGDNLTEPDVTYLCNYCRICRGVLANILDSVLTWCENEAPLYSYRHAHVALLRVIKEQDQAISKLFDLLNDYMTNNSLGD